MKRSEKYCGLFFLLLLLFTPQAKSAITSDGLGNAELLIEKAFKEKDQKKRWKLLFMPLKLLRLQEVRKAWR